VRDSGALKFTGGCGNAKRTAPPAKGNCIFSIECGDLQDETWRMLCGFRLRSQKTLKRGML
jgi:hypothetical protein